MTTIALFGATGRVGRRVLDRALAHGYTVRALVRDPARLDTTSEELTVVRGDVTDPRPVGETVAGSQAVLSLFGHVKGSPPTVHTDGTARIVEAMKAHGVTRIVSLSGGGLRAPEDRPGFADKVIVAALRLFAGRVAADAAGHLEVLRRSGLDFTVVRAPRLVDRPGTGSYRVGAVGVDASTWISRDDLADFILTQVDDRTYTGRMPFVSAGPS